MSDAILFRGIESMEETCLASVLDSEMGRVWLGSRIREPEKSPSQTPSGGKTILESLKELWGGPPSRR